MITPLLGAKNWQLCIRLFLPLLFDMLADDFFTAVTSNGADKVPFGPKFAAP